MALAQSVKAPKKAPKKTRDPLFTDEKYTGSEPVWDTDQQVKIFLILVKNSRVIQILSSKI